MTVVNQDSSLELLGGSRYVARQPILDLHGQIYGYELLYRVGTETEFRADGELASRTILDNTVIFGVENFTGGSLAFINCTSETLTEELVSVLPTNMTVLEILETVEPLPDLIAACGRLKALGFKLALDDFVWAPEFAPLVDLADYIKVDFKLTGAQKRRELIKRLKGKNIQFLAEKVETQQEYEQACAEGFTLFQGYYFCRPELVKNRKVPSNRLCHFEILRLLNTDPIDLLELSRTVKRDESLTYRLLRLVNSAAYAVREEVTSVQSALMILGEDTFRRVAMLAIVTELNSGRPQEILRMSMVRGRFCELASALCGFSYTEQYLLGMLSLLPAMLSIPMETLTPSLPLRKEIKAALEGAVNREGCLLGWLRANEAGDWAACESIIKINRLKQQDVNKCYIDAILWAESQFLLTE
ncbi:MAG: HDOD domain-containing protein [Terracidiphilus sp.]|jgi:EAL and modified HD-GYP domain-containing signal transduction protein